MPPGVAEAMRYSVFAGGKRLRPILTLAAAEAAGPRRRDSSPGNDQLDLREELSEDAARGLARHGACAIELVHTYSLVHDDLPAMDDDTLRRGRPTSHVVFGEGLAILAGDALLTQAFALLARRPPHAPPGFEARQLRAVARVAEAAGRPGGGRMDSRRSGGVAAAGIGPSAPPPAACPRHGPAAASWGGSGPPGRPPPTGRAPRRARAQDRRPQRRRRPSRSILAGKRGGVARDA